MNKIISIIMLVLPITLNANPMYFLLGKKQVNVEFDYTNTVVENLELRDFQDLQSVKGIEWERLFLEELNDEIDDDIDIQFGDYPESSYTMLCIVLSESLNGTTKMDVRFINTETLEERAKMIVYGHGGIFGSFANLVGDGMSRCGERLGEILEEKLEL